MKPKKKKLTLDQTHPELLKEWDFERNWNELGLRPEDITFGSKKKVYWICQKFPEEDKWKNSVASRINNNSGCPYCTNRKVNNRNCLATNFPELIKQWHPILNNKLTPYDVVCGSPKEIWWQCPVYKEDYWKAPIKKRTQRDDGCPFCANQKVNVRNCLAATHPELAKQWHLTLNEELKPSDITHGSNKKIWWQCPIYPEDIWKTKILHRTRNGSDCPYCCGKKANNRNCLKTTHPELMIYWNFDKNIDIFPDTCTYGSDKIVWWKCENGHEYPAAISSRYKKDKFGCPLCRHKNQTMVYEYLLDNKFSFKDEYSIRFFKDKKYPNQVDFYLPDYNLFIEYDGEQHFKPVTYGKLYNEQAEENFQKQVIRDKALVNYCHENNINLLRIDGRKYQGQKLKEYLETDFIFYLFMLEMHNV